VREDENSDNEDDDLPCAMRERLYLAKLAKSCESSLCMCVFCYHLCGEIKYIYYIDTAMHSEKSDL